MDKDRLEKLLERAVRYYFDGLSVKEAIDKAIEYEDCECKFPIVCGINPGICCNKCINECVFRCALSKGECKNEG